MPYLLVGRLSCRHSSKDNMWCLPLGLAMVPRRLLCRIGCVARLAAGSLFHSWIFTRCVAAPVVGLLGASCVLVRPDVFGVTGCIC